jgi:hypothetical protein
MKKIKVTFFLVNTPICQDKECEFNGECANHKTAGQHRWQHGMTPKMFSEGGRYFCRQTSEDSFGGLVETDNQMKLAHKV